MAHNVRGPMGDKTSGSPSDVVVKNDTPAAKPEPDRVRLHAFVADLLQASPKAPRRSAIDVARLATLALKKSEAAGQVKSSRPASSPSRVPSLGKSQVSVAPKKPKV